MKVPGLPPPRIGRPLQVTAPLLVKTQLGMSWLPPPEMLSVALVFKVSVPASVPPVQVMIPLIEEVVPPESVPLPSENRPRLLIVQGPLSVKVWPFIANVCVVTPLLAPRINPVTVGL